MHRPECGAITMSSYLLTRVLGESEVLTFEGVLWMEDVGSSPAHRARTDRPRARDGRSGPEDLGSSHWLSSFYAELSAPGERDWAGSRKSVKTLRSEKILTRTSVLFHILRLNPVLQLPLFFTLLLPPGPVSLEVHQACS